MTSIMSMDVSQKTTRGIIDFICSIRMYDTYNSHVINEIPKELLNDTIIKLMLEKWHHYYDIYILINYIPRKLLNDYIIKLMIKKCGYISDVEKVAKYIPPEMYNHEIIEIILKNPRCPITDVMKHIPRRLLNDKIIKLAVNKSNEFDIVGLSAIIPRHLYTSDIAKLSIKVSNWNNIIKVAKTFPPEVFNQKIVKLLINKIILHYSDYVSDLMDILSVSYRLTHEYILLLIEKAGGCFDKTKITDLANKIPKHLFNVEIAKLLIIRCRKCEIEMLKTIIPSEFTELYDVKVLIDKCYTKYF
jgi:hypothetical protein